MKRKSAIVTLRVNAVVVLARLNEIVELLTVSDLPAKVMSGSVAGSLREFAVPLTMKSEPTQSAMDETTEPFGVVLQPIALLICALSKHEFP